MIAFNREQAKTLRGILAEFQSYLYDRVINPVSNTLGLEPSDLRAVSDLVVRCVGEIDEQVSHAHSVRLEESFAGILKRAVLFARRGIAANTENRSEQTFHPGMREAIAIPRIALDDIASQAWFVAAQPIAAPRLTEYLSIQQAERLLQIDKAVTQRKYDEKFHVLQAPECFLPDFDHYRRRCEIRNRPVSIAFLDIDNFKTFNEETSETSVDLNVLPRFMETLEAHVFGHGYAYRQGGDEYLVLLPNMPADSALSFLEALQDAVRSLKYLSTERHTTISVGLCCLPPDCFLTEKEALGKANRAKKFAKKSGKDCIATYKGDLFREEDLYAYRPNVKDQGT